MNCSEFEAFHLKQTEMFTIAPNFLNSYKFFKNLVS